MKNIRSSLENNSKIYPLFSEIVMYGKLTGNQRCSLKETFGKSGEPGFKKVSFLAKDFSGGLGKSFFSAKEIFENVDGIELSSISVPREVISLAGCGTAGNSAEVTFSLGDNFFSKDDVHCRHMLWLCGMWDYYKELSLEFAWLNKTMPAFGSFRISVNGKVAFDDYVYFWNYRRWKFWPCVMIDADESLFRRGKNILRIENLTRPFMENVPEYYKPFIKQSCGLRVGQIPDEIKNNTTFHVSNINIVTRGFADMAVLNFPDVVNVGDKFSVEVFASRKHEIEFDVPAELKLTCNKKLSPGRNVLSFQAMKPGAKINVAMKSKTTGRTSSFTVSQSISAPREKFLLGHMLGGHLSAFAVNHDYKFFTDFFRDARQGNLLVWLADPRKAGDYITSEMLDIEGIKKNNLFVLLRYYGNNGAKFPAERPYHDEVKKMADAFDKAFVGLASHEFGSNAPKFLRETKDSKTAFEQFALKAQSLFREFKSLVPRAKTWITDPSLYSDVYCNAGADMPALELFPMHCTLNMASCRGTANALGMKQWAAINSFECQAYGGLDMFEPMAHLDPHHGEKRLNLWRLSQFYLYLAGARIIYSESGGFEQVVGRQLHLDSAEQVKFRQIQRDLFNFAGIHALSDQPVAEFAFVKPDDDMFGGYYSPAPSQEASASDVSWEKIRTAIPQLYWRNNTLERFNDIYSLQHFSDTPFGEVDVIPANCKSSALSSYKAVVFAGQHSIDNKTASRLRDYVDNGGQLIVTLADFAERDSHAGNQKILKNLCGVTCKTSNQANFLWEIKTCNQALKKDFSNCTIPNTFSRGAYDGLIIADLEMTDAEPIIVDAYTGLPFLLRRKVGNGYVWLINAMRHHVNQNYLNLVNEIIKAVFRRAGGQLKLTQGRNINYFVYGRGRRGENFQQVFLLNNDWYSRQKLHKAKFEYDDLVFNINVSREQPEEFFICRDVIVIPQSSGFRINSISAKAASVFEIECENAGPTVLQLHSSKKIKSVEAKDAAGNPVKSMLYTDKHEVPTARINHSGIFSLSIKFAS